MAYLLRSLSVAATIAGFALSCFAPGQAEQPEAGIAPPPTTSEDTDNGWPRTLTNNEQITVYQPDVESWKGNQIRQRAAVSVTSRASAEPSYGVIWIEARTEVNRAEHLVTLEDIRIIRASFPGEPGKKNELLAILKPNLPSLVRQISLDRLQANLEITQAESRARGPKLSNTPPRILFAQRPSILLLIDGRPALRDTDNPDFNRVINTRALVLLDRTSGSYYFFMGDRWMKAPSILGPWTVAPDHPGAIDSIRQELAQANQVNLMNDPQSPLMKNLAQGIVPKVLVSTRPAELVQTNGTPSLKPLSGTNLLYVDNTTNDLFLDTTDGKYYVLLSGRWYRSSKLSGPWTFVSARKLPRDFARIPQTNPKASVLASVAGTSEAEEAGIADTIPQTATVNRAQAELDVKYDGSPRFAAVSGTSLFYAVNSPVPVIEVTPSSFYAVHDGIWFAAVSPSGPWHVTDQVPAVIYTIPPSSPLYYVTFVKVYGSTPQVVYVGYTPGYLGTYWSDDGVVVYGTGFYYGPWIGSYWYGNPWTFAFGFSIGFGGYVGPVCYPWWGPYSGFRVRYPPPGFIGPHPLPPPVAWRGATISSTNVYRSWGTSVVRNAWTRAEVANRAPAPPRVGQPNSIYAGRNGHVYRYSSRGWEERAPRGGWARPAPPSHELEQSRTARGMGEERWSGFRSGAPSHPPGGSAAGIAPPRAAPPTYPFGGGGHFGGSPAMGRGGGRR